MFYSFLIKGDLQQLMLFYEALRIPTLKQENCLTVDLGETKIIYYSEPLPQSKIVFKNTNDSNEFIFDHTVYTIKE